jgi:hypothetical protein
MQRYFPLVRRERAERRLRWHTLRQHPWVMVWTMAIAQVISWGTLFYQRAGKRLKSIQVPAFQVYEQELSFFFARALRMILRRWRAST